MYSFHLLNGRLRRPLRSTAAKVGMSRRSRGDVADRQSGSSPSTVAGEALQLLFIWSSLQFLRLLFEHKAQPVVEVNHIYFKESTSCLVNNF